VPPPHARARNARGLRGVLNRAVAKHAPPWLTLVEEAFGPGP
jgi:hypothetical protein|tara:strand:+ start:4098 stop:4223 length:126 start_codon:yes stop_codon:yes gene_type:complete